MAKGDIDYSHYPKLKDIIEAKGGIVRGKGGGSLQMSWGWNEEARKARIVRIKLDESVIYVDKEDLLYMLRAVPRGKEKEDAELWQSMQQN